MFIQCCNNTVLLPINPRKLSKKTRKNKSFVALAKPQIQLKPESAMKTQESGQFLSKSVKKLQVKSIDLNSSFDIDSCPSDSLNDILKQIIAKELSTLKALQSRCLILDKLVKGTQNFSSFTNKETSDFIKLIEEMTRTLIKTSEMEVELGKKNRISEKKSLENASLKHSNSILAKRSQQSELELKELRDKLKIFTEENTKLQKNNEIEKQRYAEVNNRIQTLEDTLWVVMNSATFSTQDSVTKLKSAISALLKDIHVHRRKYKLCKAHVET